MERLVSLVLVTLFCFGTHGIPTAESPKASAKSGKYSVDLGDVDNVRIASRKKRKNKEIDSTGLFSTVKPNYLPVYMIEAFWHDMTKELFQLLPCSGENGENS